MEKDNIGLKNFFQCCFYGKPVFGIKNLRNNLKRCIKIDVKTMEKRTKIRT